MKKFLYLFAFVMAIFATSCTSETSIDEATLAKSGVITIQHTPDIVAYSGSNFWGSTFVTRGTDMNANMWDQTWDCPTRDAEDLTDEELAELKDLLTKPANTVNTVVLPFENYYVQQIYKGEDSYYGLDRCAREAYNGSGEIKCNGNNDCDHLTSGDHSTPTSVLGSNHMDKLLAKGKNGYEHINNFNNGTNGNYPNACGCGEVHYKTTLMTDMPTTGIDPNEQFGFHETFGTSHDYFNYIIVEYKGYYYVGFDYEAHKPDQGTHNHNEALDVERDWKFTDWIVRITPAYHKGETPKKDDEEVTTTPVLPTIDEVEINLTANDAEVSHLSIHVRTATNVEVFIPIPAEYYCDVDDMAIVNKHEGELLIHGGPTKTEYNVNGNTVTLNVEFKENGIRIWTEGITQEVIDYCRETYNDGITFEVWNYFNGVLTKAELLKLLKRSTVKFLDKIPELYVNAFNDDEDGNMYEWDATVNIVEEQSDEFLASEKGKHYNGSEYNDLYRKK